MQGEPTDLNDEDLDAVTGGAGPGVDPMLMKHAVSSPAEDILSGAMSAKLQAPQATSGVGTIGSAAGSTYSQSDYKAAEAEADKAEAEAAQQVAQHKADDNADFIRAYTDNVKAVLDKLASIKQAEADTMRQIIRG